MKGLLLISLGIAMGTLQAAPLPEGSEKVLYISKVPSQVRERMRGHGPTRFYGETVIQEKTVALHLYNTHSPKRIRDRASVVDMEQAMRLDIFIQSQHNNKVLFERVHSLPLSFSGFKSGRCKVMLHSLALDPETYTIPLLKMTLESQLPSGGMVGNDCLFVFPKGLKGAVAKQSFTYDFLEGPVSISGVDFSTMDAKAYLTILQSEMDGSNLDLVGLKWNGKEFAPAAKAHEDRTSSVRVKWTGEKMEYVDEAQK